MAPKAKPSKATAAKAKQKLDDKTFGMKNKKGSKNQKFIATEQKAAGMDKGAKARAEAKRIEDRRNKIEDEKRLKRQQDLLKAKIQAAKEAAAIKSGNVKALQPAEDPEPEEPQRVTGASITLTVGPTELTAEQQAKLARKNAPKKEKVVEVVISLEELIEKERAALHKKGNLTPVNVESFAAWKAKVKKVKLAQEKKQLQDKKMLNKKTGREYFSQANVTIHDADEEDEAEVDGRIEVREKRMTEDDKDTLVFAEKQGELPKVEDLSLSNKPVDDVTAPDSVAPPGGAKADDVAA